MNRIEKEIGDLCQTQLFALSALGSAVVISYYLSISLSTQEISNLEIQKGNGNLQNPIPFFHFK